MEDFIGNIDKLIEGTKKGKITWEPHNKAFIWMTQNDKGQKINVVLQTKLLHEIVSQILFRLWDVDNQKSLMEIDSDSVSKDVKNKIFKLYEVAKDSSNLGNIDVLSDLLKGF